MTGNLLSINIFLVTILIAYDFTTIARNIDAEKSECPDECQNGINCNAYICANCQFTCGEICQYNKPEIRKTSCGQKCEGTCPLTTFRDVTVHKLPKSWFKWLHSGKPYTNENAPLFVDLNGDGILDVFNSMHGHTPDKNGYDRMELGESVVQDLKIKMRFKSVSSRIYITDQKSIWKMMDPHGQNIIDLDGDGHNDMMISSGGNMGKAFPQKGLIVSGYNFLLWGKLSFQESKVVSVFQGGRNSARLANVHMPYGRGRVNYMMDVNGDGLIDIFCMQDRHQTNNLAPGVLLINQGDRTWKEDPSMSEYTQAMMLTDADGDGIAQEIILVRGFCYPQRAKLDVESLTEDIKEFCSTRPGGTIAVFKYDYKKKNMMEISKKYFNVSPDSNKQPGCCPHGLFTGQNDCQAISIASGDFDKDEIADHVFLYQSKLVLFYSSDRPKGTLPINQKYITAEISLPCKGKSVRVLDIDNDGNEEIFVLCHQAANFLVYTKGKTKRDWTLENKCNEKGSLGDLSDESLTNFNSTDLIEACDKKGKGKWQGFDYACETLSSGNKVKSVTAGISIIDLNNDGFLDAVVTYDIGYTRYFHSKPSSKKRKNRFIVFKIVGAGYRKDLEEGTFTNEYAIGVTILLKTKRKDKVTREKIYKNQFREISTYQHVTDKYGYKDDRITFGLGKKWKPIQVKIRWPNGRLKIIDLNSKKNYRKWKVIEITEENLTEASSIPTLSDSEIPSKLSNIPSIITTKFPTISTTSMPSDVGIQSKLSSIPSIVPTKVSTIFPTNISSQDSPSFTPSICFEGLSDQFVWYLDQKDKEIKKSCEWISNLNKKQITKICENTWNDARYICPITCEMCKLSD